jgi:enoyl-CoA hydratase/carnithine racemase
VEAKGVSDIVAEIRGCTGFITLHRPRALNALSLQMIRDLTEALLAWRDDAAVACVAIRGQGKEGPFGVFCAGGDIRFFHVVALAGDPQLEDFFTEEYTLNHLVHNYPKPFVAFMDGIVMGGGSLRIVTERTKVAMPETSIGLFPDVGGGYFLGRCPGRMGEYLALTGQVIGGEEAVAAGLADRLVSSSELPGLWLALERGLLQEATKKTGGNAQAAPAGSMIDRFFSLASVQEIVLALEADGSAWAAETAALLRRRSPLMLHVTLEQVRRSRTMALADDLRMERGLMRRCFHLRPGTDSETVEGIRALAVDKDQKPKWNPARIEDVTPEMVAPFFESPWPPHAHPLRHLA